MRGRDVAGRMSGGNHVAQTRLAEPQQSARRVRDQGVYHARARFDPVGLFSSDCSIAAPAAAARGLEQHHFLISFSIEASSHPGQLLSSARSGYQPEHIGNSSFLGGKECVV